MSKSEECFFKQSNPQVDLNYYENNHFHSQPYIIFDIKITAFYYPWMNGGSIGPFIDMYYIKI